MQHKPTPLLCALLLLLPTACADGEPPLDGRDDDFLVGGKADLGFPQDGPEARGILALVNQAALETLDRATGEGGVGLDRRAAENIVAFRLGDDLTEDTADDRRFATLEELDAVPYVGPVSLTLLWEYAAANGFVPGTPESTDGPFSPASCAGEAVSLSELADLFAPGATAAHLGDYQMVGRERQCNEVTGCAAWRELTSSDANQGLYGEEPWPVGRARLEVAGNDIVLDLSAAYDASSLWCTRIYRTGTRCTGVTSGQLSCDTMRYVTAITGHCYVADLHIPGSANVQMTGTIGSDCFRLHTAASYEITGAPGGWTEVEAAILVSF